MKQYDRRGVAHKLGLFVGSIFAPVQVANGTGLFTQFNTLEDITLASAVTLTATQKENSVFEIATGHVSNVLTLGMTRGRVVVIVNGSSANCLVKNKSTDTAVTVANAKAALLYVDHDGVIRRLTADSALT